MLNSPSERRSGKNRQALLVCLLLAAVTLAAFWPVRRNGFVNYDDPGYVTENPHIQHGLTWASAGWAFRSGYAANWHPLTWLSHMLDVQVFGLNPAGHHATNLLFHIANTILVFLLLWRATGASWRSAFVAALFGVHPLRVESVAWIAERKDVLSTFFGLLAIWAYAAYVKAESRKQKPGSRIQQPVSGFTHHASHLYLLSLLLFAFSLMSKPMLVTLPFVLLLLDYWPLQRFQRKTQDSRLKTFVPLFLEKLPFLLLSAAVSIVTFLVQQHGGSVSSTDALPIGSRCANAVMAYVAYLGKVVWPAHLSVFYPYPQGWPSGQVVAATAFLLAITALAVRARRKAPSFLIGWFWYLGALVPVIGLVQVGFQSMADRYTYFSSIGLFLALGWPVAEVAHRWRFGPSAAGVTGAVVIGLCLYGTRTQVSCWKDSETLFRHALAVTASNCVAHGNLGQALVVQGKLPEAEAEFRKVLRINPDYYPVLYALGSLQRTNGHLAEAVALYVRALQLRPNDAVAHYNHGIVLADQQKIGEAIEEYRAALRLDPELAQAHNNLAGLLIGQGEAKEGLSHALTALRITPNSPLAHVNAGHALFLQEKFPEAETHYWQALKLDSGLPDARLNLAKALANQDRLAEAESQLKEVGRLRPAEPEAHQALAAIYASQQRAREAATEYAAALRADPQWTEGMKELAWLLATHPDNKLRNGAEAVRLAERACALTGATNYPVLETLAAAYAETGRFGEAVAMQQKVCDWAVAQGQTTQAEPAKQRLALYRSGEPCREP